MFHAGITRILASCNLKAPRACWLIYIALDCLISTANHSRKISMQLFPKDLVSLLAHVPWEPTDDIIDLIVLVANEILPCYSTKNAGTETYRDRQLPPLESFLKQLVLCSNVNSGTLLATLVYLQRFKSRFSKNALGSSSTKHRLLLICLVVSVKYHCDMCPSNALWSYYTNGVFSANDINVMERQLLRTLNWNMEVSAKEMYALVIDFVESSFSAVLATAHDVNLSTTYVYSRRAAVSTASTKYTPVSAVPVNQA